MQRWGLEWLYRVLQEPHRMWKRYRVTNAKFGGVLVREKMRQLLGGLRWGRGDHRTSTRRRCRSMIYGFDMSPLRALQHFYPRVFNGPVHANR